MYCRTDSIDIQPWIDEILPTVLIGTDQVSRFIQQNCAITKQCNLSIILIFLKF
ncbi:unnamed protein product [Onchocerca flexuosa]|uniref:Transposase n=1 Tax=Onchocerca flexuosa TaxID=387005 RepID=A0A183GZJ8_9BILA|nr:unnamed protein product [Onchocerca flexuosa]